ncbi:MAG: type II secretion system F family protein [Dermatophilaceae bacterium]
MNAASWSALLVAAAVLGWPRGTSAVGGQQPSPHPRLADPRSGSRADRRRQRLAESAVLAVLDALAAALRVGLTPDTALRHLADVDHGPVGRLAWELLAAGRAGGQCWRNIAGAAGAPEVLVVAQAWELSHVAGVRLADAVDLAARLLRQGRARRDRREVALAGPRATIAVLTVLPLLGPGVGMAVGIDPFDLYAGTGLARVSTGAGLVMLISGRLWAAALVRRSMRAVPQSWSASAVSREWRRRRPRISPAARASETWGPRARVPGPSTWGPRARVPGPSTWGPRARVPGPSEDGS